jgi:hypothetical protein
MVQSLTKALDVQSAQQKSILERMKTFAAASAAPDPDPLPVKEVPPLSSKESNKVTEVQVHCESVEDTHVDNPSEGLDEGPWSKAPTNSKVDAPILESDDDKESEDKEVRTSREQHSQRRRVIAATLSKNPHFQFETSSGSTISESACAMYGMSVMESVSDILPVQRGLYDELKRFATSKASKGHKVPDKVLRKMYKVPEVQMTHWNNPPNVPEDLLNVVEHRKVKFLPKPKLWVLNPDHESGKREKALVEDLARQQLLLKISNCLSLSVVALLLLPNFQRP